MSISKKKKKECNVLNHQITCVLQAAFRVLDQGTDVEVSTPLLFITDHMTPETAPPHKGRGVTWVGHTALGAWKAPGPAATGHGLRGTEGRSGVWLVSHWGHPWGGAHTAHAPDQADPGHPVRLVSRQISQKPDSEGPLFLSGLLRGVGQLFLSKL